MQSAIKSNVKETGVTAVVASANRHRWQFMAKVAFGLALLGFVLYLVDLREAGVILVNLNGWYLLPVVVLYYLDRALMAYKWRPLLQALNVRVPFFILYRLYLVAQVVSVLLPATVGADLFRLYGLSRHNVSSRAVFASIVAERLIGFLAMLVLATISMGLVSYLLMDRWDQFGPIGWALVGASAVGVLALFMALVFSRKWAERLASRLPSKSILGKLFQIYTMFYEYRKRRRVIATVVAWTFLEQMFSVVVAFLLVRALHIDVSWLELVAVVPLIVLAIRIPISFEGFGVQEALYIVFFSLIGVSLAEALVLSAVTRVIYLLCTLPWGIHYLFWDHQKPLPQQQATMPV